MSVSGWCDARCKICGCIFNHYSSGNFHFIDQEIVGTCNDCFDRKDHDIYNENIVKEFNSTIPEILGRITFHKNGTHLITMEGKE